MGTGGRILFRAAVPLVLLACLAACTDRVTFSSDADLWLEFSDDTVSFDTVFTQTGSPTGAFMIYNRNDRALKVDVMLAGGADSPFRINVDGESGTQMNNLELRASDSLFCFLSVNIAASDSDTPILVEDSVCFLLESGNRQTVHLMAFGQDVIRLYGAVADSDMNLTSARPYLIFDSLFIADGAVLNIAAGARLFFHDGAWLGGDGRIVADGTCDSMIVMRGDRLDNLLTDIPYDLSAGRWGGVILNAGSYDNLLRGCDIHGGRWGVLADTSDVQLQKVLIDGCIIHNVEGNALELNHCRSVVSNSQISNAGQHCVSLLGGNNSFDFCTIANFYPWDVHESALFISNLADTTLFPMSLADFSNCIITGNSSDEVSGIVRDSVSGMEPAQFCNYSIRHSLVLVSDTTDEHMTDCVWDRKPHDVYGAANFIHVAKGDFLYDFRLDSLSMARGIAPSSATSRFDITGLPRPETQADAGCYQYVEP